MGIGMIYMRICTILIIKVFLPMKISQQSTYPANKDWAVKRNHHAFVFGPSLCNGEAPVISIYLKSCYLSYKVTRSIVILTEFLKIFVRVEDHQL